MENIINRCLGVESLKTTPLKALGVIIVILVFVMGLSACETKIKDTDGDCYADKVEKNEGTDPLDPNSTPPDEDGDCITDAQEALMDSDKDGVINNIDNCKGTPNVNQSDRDGDLVGDVCDNCPDAKNTKQVDKDADMIGDACDNAPKDRKTRTPTASLTCWTTVRKRQMVQFQAHV